MGKRTGALSEADKAFIAEQKIFFIASSSGKEVNLSPRGYDCFRILGENEAVFLDYAGSGNRTARDIGQDGEVTVMFCSFGPAPMILRLFCRGEIVDKQAPELQSLFPFPDLRGMRRFVRLRIYCVEHSCGMSVPRYDFVAERNDLKEWCRDEDRAERLDEYLQRHDAPPDLEPFRCR